MIVVTGHVVARAGSFDALLEASLAHVRRSRTEDGCIAHAVAVDAENPLKLVFAEEWRDRAALAVHFRQPGSATFVRAARELADGATALDIFDGERIDPAALAG